MDAWLLKKAERGDCRAFADLMEKYKVSLYKVARCYLRNEEDIADMMQETVLLAWEHMAEIRNMAYFKTWITRILINQCKDLLKRQKKLTFVDWTEEMDEFFLADEASVEKTLEDDEGFYELLDMISEGYRTVFLLYYGEGFNSREIAEILQVSENTVRSRLRRGKRQLKEKLQPG